MIDPASLPWKLRESCSPGWKILTTAAGDMIGRLRADVAEAVLRLPGLLEAEREKPTRRPAATVLHDGEGDAGVAAGDGAA